MNKEPNNQPESASPLRIEVHPPHHDKYRNNKDLSNFILLPLSGMLWVGSFIFANQNKISPIQSNFARAIWQLISIFIIIKLRNQDVDFKDGKDFRRLLLRSLISAMNGAMAGLFQMYLPLTVYYTINASTTVFSFLLNYFLYHVPISTLQARSIIAALIGIVLVINGRAIYQLVDSSFEFSSKFDYTSTDLWVQIMMGLLVVVWSCVWAYGIVITGKHHASFHQFIYINSVEVYLISGLFYNCLELPSQLMGSHLFVRRPDKFLGTLVYCGIPMAAANYVFMLGMFISENTGVSTILNQLNIVYVYFISTIRYDEEINLVCLFGAVLLLGSIYTTVIK